MRRTRAEARAILTSAIAATEPKTRTETEYQELRAATTALASCCVFVLSAKGVPGIGSGMVFNTKTKVAQHWAIQFLDALDMVGLCYDRDVYFAGLSGGKKKKRADPLRAVSTNKGKGAKL